MRVHRSPQPRDAAGNFLPSDGMRASCNCHVDAMGHEFNHVLLCGRCGVPHDAHGRYPLPCRGKETWRSMPVQEVDAA